MLMPAFVVIGQNLDDPAFPHWAVGAIVQHVPQLGLQEGELLDAALHALEMPENDPVGRFAGLFRLGAQAEKLPDRLHLKP
jgi:hypothetical protein